MITVELYTKVQAMPISDDETQEECVKTRQYEVSIITPLTSSFLLNKYKMEHPFSGNVVNANVVSIMALMIMGGEKNSVCDNYLGCLLDTGQIIAMGSGKLGRGYEFQSKKL